MRFACYTSTIMGFGLLVGCSAEADGDPTGRAESRLSAAPFNADAPAPELLYVARADSGPVAAYAASATGDTSPVASLSNPNNPSTVWDPWGVAIDAQRNIVVQSFLSDATTFVFPPCAGAATLPSRIFRGAGPDTRAIAVDESGYEYIASGEGSAQIFVLPPGAAGEAADLYQVSPLRTIATDEQTWHPWASILTTDGAGHVVAAVVRAEGNALEFFQAGPVGPSAPLRTVTGSHTGLGSCGGAACDQAVVTFSRYTGRFYVGVTAGASTHISVFASDANGDAAPIRTIEGLSTGLSGTVITGIANSQRTGEIFALVKDAQFGGQGRVQVYGRYQNGNTPPERTFRDRADGFVDAQGIALTP